jgi:CIC family chloride channel protein
MGVAYNNLLLGALAAAERLWRWLPGDLRAATVGAAVGLLAWFTPGLVGGGDAITQHTHAGGDSMMLISGVFLVRFALGPLSYATGTPGELIAPMLVRGAQGGLVLGTLFCAMVVSGSCSREALDNSLRMSVCHRTHPFPFVMLA